MTNAPNDLSAFWMPFTANRAFKTAPRLFARAEGMHYDTPDGRKVLDGTGGLWCVNAGHNRKPIIEAITRAAATLDFAPTFQFGHPLAFEAAARLAAILPDGFDQVFFTNSGSESADTALKIALAYHRARGEPGRVRLVGRARGYHGTNFGGMSVGGIQANRAAFGQLLPYVDHLPHTHALQHNAFSRGQPGWGAHLAEELERLVALHGAGSIAAVMVEPVAGSTGVLVPPRGYLETLREICTRHGILLIYDEVITAFGRIGGATAAEKLGVMPDIITLAKGLTNAAVPMGAVGVRGAVHDAIVEAGPEQGIEFAHGYTYSGHPLACAAAIAALDIYRDEGLFGAADRLGGLWQEALHDLRDAQHVIDIRNLGLIGGIELAPSEAGAGRRAMAVLQGCFEAGLLIRVTGDIIALSPPLILQESHIGQITDTLRAVLARTA